MFESKIQNIVNLCIFLQKFVFELVALMALLRIFFFLILMLTRLIAHGNSNINDLSAELITGYNSLLEGKVTNGLLANYKKYQNFPNEYWSFVNETFSDNWNFDATTKALIGHDIFNSLSEFQFKELSRVLEITLLRYAFESLSFYREQRLNVIDIKLNEQQTFAWLKVNMDSPRLPDIHLDILLNRRDDDQWKGVDFRFKGITYVNMKKNSYRQDFEDLKFHGLLRKLNNKNKTFFRDLCRSDVNYIDPKKPPCLQDYD